MRRAPGNLQRYAGRSAMSEAQLENVWRMHRAGRARTNPENFDALYQLGINLEATYLTMWQRHRNGEPPASFAVNDAAD